MTKKTKLAPPTKGKQKVVVKIIKTPGGVACAKQVGGKEPIPVTIQDANKLIQKHGLTGSKPESKKGETIYTYQ